MSCALYLPRAACLFSGYALMTLDPMFGAPSVAYAGSAGAVVFAEDDRDDHAALAGLAALAALAGHLHAAFLPAHGEPWTAPGSVGRAIVAAVISTP